MLAVAETVGLATLHGPSTPSGHGASRYPQIVVDRRRAGAPIEAFDALIAATALVAGAAVATRDVAGLKDCGLTIINPWDATGQTD